MAHPLPVEKVTSLARALACRIAWTPDDVDDLTQDALFAYLTASRKYARQQIRRPWLFAWTVLRRAMWNFYRDTLRDPVETRSEPLLSSDATLEQIHWFECTEFLVALEHERGPLARTMVEQLMNPSGECAKKLLDQVRRRRIRQRRSRRTIRGGGKFRIPVTHQSIRRALGLSETEYWKELRGIRKFALRWFTQ